MTHAYLPCLDGTRRESQAGDPHQQTPSIACLRSRWGLAFRELSASGILIDDELQAEVHIPRFAQQLDHRRDSRKLWIWEGLGQAFRGLAVMRQSCKDLVTHQSHSFRIRAKSLLCVPRITRASTLKRSFSFGGSSPEQTTSPSSLRVRRLQWLLFHFRTEAPVPCER